MSTYLLAWNPQSWQWDEQEFADTIRRVRLGQKVSRRWSCGTTKRIQLGDRVFLIRLGLEPKGIFSSGFVTRSPYAAPHWDPDRQNNGERALFIEFQYDTLLDPNKEAVLARSLLKHDPRFSAMHWDTQMSGVSIPDPIAAELELEWSNFNGQDLDTLPEELVNPAKYVEGAKRQVLVNAYERSREARRVCIEHYGSQCAVCDFDFERAYGLVGRGLIHVHHLTPLAEIDGTYELDPIRDLKPVCPNCHAIIHRRTPPYSIEDVRGFIQRARACSINPICTV